MKYSVKVYPNVNWDVYEVEADSVEEAIKLAEEHAMMNCFFMATESDVEEIDEVE